MASYFVTRAFAYISGWAFGESTTHHHFFYFYHHLNGAQDSPRNAREDARHEPGYLARGKIASNRISQLGAYRVVQVVSYLSPRDVLQLARLSEDLYSVFTSSISKVLWKAARKSVDCPAPVTGFSEMAWAHLLHVNKCHVRVSFAARLGFSDA